MAEPIAISSRIEHSAVTEPEPESLSIENVSENMEENIVNESTEHLKNRCDNIVDEKVNCSSEERSENSFKAPPPTNNTFAVPLSLSSKPSKKSYLEDNEKGKDFADLSVVKTPSTSKERVISSRDDSQQIQTLANYKEPEWSGEAEDEFSFDVLKNGTIIDNVPLKGKAFFIFGRLQSCDVTLEHPSLSRYHAVIQYSKDTTSTHEKGWYIYDLDSTHGTWVNKKKVNPKVYHRIKVGYIVKFGGSSRLHILQGPEDDAEEESEMSITEMKEQKEKQKREAELLRQIDTQEEQERAEKERKMLEDKGCGWGMGEDAEEVADDNPFASLAAENEHLYIDDPKKTLKGFYEREGIDLPDYQFTEMSSGSHKCRLEIPVDGPNGEELVAEAVVSGKKKDAVVACALEACRLLDKLGMLRSSTHESRKRKGRNWEDNDFYDSDEDTFLDRTGTIEKKRTMRMKKAGKESAETYDSLMIKYTKVTERMQEIEIKLEKAKAESEALAKEEMDELDAYMVSIKLGVMDTKTRLHLKGELLRLKMEEQNLRRLVNIAKPASLPPLKPVAPATSSPADKISTTENISRKLQHAQQKKQWQKKPLPVKETVVQVKPDDYEEEEQDDDEIENEEKPIDNSAFANSRLKSSTVQADRVKEKGQREKSERLSANPNSESSNDTLDRPKSKKSQFFSTSAALETMDKRQSATKHAKAPESNSLVNLDELDPKFATWLPPSEQSGDGRTSLNDKYGY